jgi:uncharacterized protein YndB with AHSA1/START domain
MPRSVKITRYFDTTVERVWECITDKEIMSQWLMPNDFAPVVGHRFTFRTKPRLKFGFDGIIHCRVIEIIPFKKLRYSWQGGPGDGSINLDTIVTWALEPDGQGTLLHFEHSGFEGIRNFIPYLIMGKGWKSIIGERLLSSLQKNIHAATTN